MSSSSISVRVPATTANLGPGFDCMGLVLDLWNRATFTLSGEGVRVNIKGEGIGRLPTDEHNPIARAFLKFYSSRGIPAPAGIEIVCDNQIPLSSGLGSSAAASLAGLLGANAFLGQPANIQEILRLAIEIEGHPDNAAAALWGGLVVVISHEQQPEVFHFEPAPLKVVVVLPSVNLPTSVSRAALPKMVPMADAVYNIGRTALVLEALRSGDLILLGKAMRDRLHQPYRLKLIQGAEQALQAACQSGAAAAAISGAGPSLIAFPVAEGEPVAARMVAVLEQFGQKARSMVLSTTPQNAAVE
ncbi:MAG: homoserine kinase [Anaerolineaceae bacterium]|nr:homoserine kinase [Anaerolineaceae bacterium]